MANAINFQNVKKQTFKITLPGKKVRTLVINPPTKKLLNEITNYSVSGDNAFDGLYELTRKILNTNLNGIKISAEQLEEMFDIADISQIFNGYQQFLKSILNQKN